MLIETLLFTGVKISDLVRIRIDDVALLLSPVLIEVVLSIPNH